jgi:hypothetical protein
MYFNHFKENIVAKIVLSGQDVVSLLGEPMIHDFYVNL